MAKAQLHNFDYEDSCAYRACIDTEYKTASMYCETIEEAYEFIETSCQSAMHNDVYYSWEIFDNTVDPDDDYADDYIEGGDWDTPECCGWTPKLIKGFFKE